MQRSQVLIERSGIRNHNAQIIRGQIKWNGSLVNQSYAVIDFRSADFEIKDRVLHGLAAALCFGARLVCRAVRINNEMKDRVICLEIIQINFGPDEGEDLHTNINTIHARVWNLARRLEPVDRQAIRFEGKMPQRP